MNSPGSELVIFERVRQVRHELQLVVRRGCHDWIEYTESTPPAGLGVVPRQVRLAQHVARQVGRVGEGNAAATGDDHTAATQGDRFD
jgi:hypothetical protein